MNKSFQYRISNNHVYVKNIATQGLMKFDNTHYKQFLDNKPNIINQLQSMNFFQTNIDKTCLSFMIVSTTKCNLRCEYCFEDHIEDFKSLNDEEKVITFIDECINNKEELKMLNITFTGGEPTLNIDFIKQVVTAINNKYSGKHILNYSIITNGTLLSEDILGFLNKNKFSVQVTFDGSSKLHDLERYFTRQVGSYNLIQNKMLSLFENTDQILVNLRINISENNRHTIIDLIDDISDKFSKYKHRFKIDFDFISARDDSIYYVSRSERLGILESFFKHAADLKINFNKEFILGGLCMLKHDAAFTINADGSIYDCYSLIDHNEFILGNIYDCFEMPEYISYCSEDCSVWTKCAGGCIFDNYIEASELTKRCDKKFLEDINKFLFLLEINNFEDGIIKEIEKEVENVSVITTRI